MKSGNTITGEAVDAAQNCRKRWFSSIAGICSDDAYCRDTQQHHGWSLEYCTFLDYLKKIPITYSATQGERPRYKNHFLLKWKRARMAYRGQGYARQRPIDLQLRSQLRDECQQWSHIRGTQAPSSSSSSTT